MSTGYVLTCGTSLTNSLKALLEPRSEEGRRRNEDDPIGSLLLEGLDRIADGSRERLVQSFKEYEPTLQGMLGDFAGLRGLAQELLEPTTAAVEAEANDAALRSLGVELESLVRRARGRGPRKGLSIGPKDPIALLVSDTPDGTAAGLLVAFMTGRPVRLFRHQPDAEREDRAPIGTWTSEVCPAHVQQLEDAAPVDVYVVPGLSVAAQISDAAPWLARALIRTVAAHDDDPSWSGVQQVETELSGGFKATIPLIHSLLEYCAAITERRIRCVFRHERNSSNWIEAGLRGVSRKELREHLREVRQAKGREVPSVPRLLQGFAWTVQDDVPEPTPEGYGILEFPQL
jgi:hypothetical protein